jgi:hypothetical protein
MACAFAHVADSRLSQHRRCFGLERKQCRSGMTSTPCIRTPPGLDQTMFDEPRTDMPETLDCPWPLRSVESASSPLQARPASGDILTTDLFAAISGWRFPTEVAGRRR